MSHYVTFQIFLGAIFSLGLIVFTRRMNSQWEFLIYSVSLIIAALIYVGFALRGGALAWITLEVFGLAFFSVLAILGLKVSAWVLVFGWLLHPAWDVLLHLLPDVVFVPHWYPITCVSFDLLLAGYIAVRLIKVRSFAPSKNNGTLNFGQNKRNQSVRL